MPRNMCLPYQFVSRASNRDQVGGVGGVFLDLLSKPTHVNIDCPCIAGKIVSPDSLQQLVTREHQALIGSKESQKIEFFSSQTEQTVAPEDLVPLDVDFQIPDINGGRLRGRRLRHSRTPQEGT